MVISRIVVHLKKVLVHVSAREGVGRLVGLVNSHKKASKTNERLPFKCIELALFVVRVEMLTKSLFDITATADSYKTMEHGLLEVIIHCILGSIITIHSELCEIN